MAKPAFVILGALALAGCATADKPPVDVAAIPGEHRIAAADIVDIALSSGDETHVDRLSMEGSPFGYRPLLTGPIWAEVFRGNENSPARIAIVAGVLNGQPGFQVKRMNFEAHALLYIGDERISLVGHGSRAAAVAVESATRQAIELAIVDCARQAEAIVKLRLRRTHER